MSTEMPDAPQQRQIVVCPLAGQQIPFQPQLADLQDGEKEIDLLGIARKAWKYKKIIIFSILVFTALGVAYASMRPNVYKAAVALDPTKHLNVKNVDSGGIAQRLGGLMSLGLGGGGFGSGSNEPQYIKAIMGTHRFHLWMIRKYDLRVWTKFLAPKADVKKLTDDDIAGIFGGSFELELDQKGFASLKVRTSSPMYSAKLAIIIVDAINSYTAQTAIDRARMEIDTFNKELESATYLETRQMLYALITERTKTIMLAKAQPEYAFQIMDPPAVLSGAEPKRKSLIVVLSFLVGSFVGGVIAICLDLRLFQYLTAGYRLGISI